MGPLLLFAALASASASEGYAIVLSSSSADIPAKTASELWARAAGEVLAPAPGYPRVVDSEMLAGGEPGRKVVLLGDFFSVEALGAFGTVRYMARSPVGHASADD